MIPILFSSSETAFTSNGLGRLVDATKCEVTEERNGQYELVLNYPVTGPLMTSLLPGAYIYATHDESKVPQAFQIYSVSAPLEGVCTVNAWHISYLLNNIILEPFTAASCTATMAAIPNHSMNSNPFLFSTDKSVTKDFSLEVPASVRSILGGTAGSILDVYGTGEYEFDMFTVKLWVNRGQNRNVSIRYGKNLTKLDQTLDGSNVYNAVVPYWTDGDGTTVCSDTLVVRTGETAGKAIALDLSNDWDEAPTVNELKTKAQTIIDGSDSYKVEDNIKIDFVALWQTEEYKSLASLQRVYLCDTVNIFYAKRGINATAKVIKVVYDTLLERYNSIELGEPRTTLAQQIVKDVSASVLPEVPSRSSMQAAIDKATELISGGYGGYIKYHYLSDGTPSEILIMDSPDEGTAVHIIRMNQNGIGFSSDGGSTYSSAWTIDGNFNASFITTGVLDADLLTAGIIQDTSGNNYWNLDTGQLVTKQGTLGSFTIDSNGVKSGTIGVGTTGSQLIPSGINYTYFNSVQGSTTKTELNAQHLNFAVANSGDNSFTIAGQIEPAVSNGYGRLSIAVDPYDAPHITMYDMDNSSRPYKTEFGGPSAFGDDLMVQGDADLRGDVNVGVIGTPADLTVTGALTVGGLETARIHTATNISSAGSYAYTLTSGHMYLIVTSKYNNTSTAASGLWIAAVGSTSALTQVYAGASVSATISGTTLTVTTGITYVRLRIIELG